MSKLTPFWIVWSPTGSAPPRVQHNTISEARAEAARLARTTPGAKFYVLEADSCVCKSDVSWSFTHDEEDIPF